MKIITLEEVVSTNSYATSHEQELEDMTLIRAVTQTAGRGQRGNSWEAEPGMNLTFTIFCHPQGVAPRKQFSISEATALGICDYLASRGIEAKVKWPNDIYVGEKKICGILIEHSLMGQTISRTVIGAGINVNQRRFVSDAPNPVSMSLLTGEEYDLERETEKVGRLIGYRLKEASTREGRKNLHEGFLKKLWRGDGGTYPFKDRKDGRIFEGIIENVEPEGMLLIRDSVAGETKKYAFKEVEFLLFTE